MIEFVTHDLAGIAVIEASGRLDALASPHLDAVLKRATEAGRTRLVADPHHSRNWRSGRACGECGHRYGRGGAEPVPGFLGWAAMDKWECTICGYVYDPATGDPDAGVQPGTAFEDLPDDWVCPECGAGKDMFEKAA